MGGNWKNRKAKLAKLQSRELFGKAGAGRATVIPDKKKETKKKACRKPVKIEKD